MATDVVVMKTDTEGESNTARSSPAQSTNDSDGAAVTDTLLQTNGNGGGGSSSSDATRGDEEADGGASSGTESVVNSTALTNNDADTPVNGVSPSANTAQSPGAAPGLEPLVPGDAESPGTASAISGGSNRAAVAAPTGETGEPSSKRLCLDVSATPVPAPSPSTTTMTSSASAPPSTDVTGQRAFEMIESSLLKLKREVRALDLLVRQKERDWDSLLKLRKVKEETFQRLRRKRKVLLLQCSDVAVTPSALSVTPVPASGGDVANTRKSSASTAPRKAPSLSSLSSSVSVTALASSSVALPSYTQSMALRKPGHTALPLQQPPAVPLQQQPPPSSVVAAAAAAAANDARFRDALAQIIKMNKPTPELSVHQVSRSADQLPPSAVPPSGGQQLPASVSPVSQQQQQQQQQSSLAKLLIESKRKQNDAVLSEILKHPQISLVSPMSRSAAVAAAVGAAAAASLSPLTQPAARVTSVAAGVAGAPSGNAAAAEAVPVCQGCRLRQAQFVCAGCGNQWYCSRECQVASWDSHAEECTE